MYVGAMYVHSGRSQQALQYLRPALEYHEVTGDRLRLSNGLSWLGLAYQRLSRFDEALACYERAASVCAGKNAYREGVMHASVGDVLTILGRVDEAMESCRRGLQLSRDAGDRENESATLTNLGNACRRLGMHRDAREYLEEALQIAGDEDLPPVEGKAHYRLGQVHRAMGDLDQAQMHLNKALELIRRVGGEATECEVLVDLAALRLDQDDHYAARKTSRKALALAIEMRDRYQEARALECLAATEDCMGVVDLADLHREQAAILFANLGVRRRIPTGRVPPDPRL
jgi:tetratricopeptide (TPR) repeat protein